MRVFVTGATGFIGSAVVKDLIAAGHQVLGLARSEAGAAALAEAGAEVERGELGDLENLTAAAARCDGIIHLAFNHDFSTYLTNSEDDRRVITALASALAGSRRPLVVTSGTGVTRTAPGELAREDGPLLTTAEMPRVASDEAADAAVARGVNASVVRLPQVHDTTKQGFVSIAIAVARERGVSAYVGDGANRWPAAHVLDTARLYRLALEAAEPGARYHAVAEEGVALREIAEVIGKRLGLPVASLTPAEAPAHFGWFAGFVGRDVPASSAWTRERLGWTPTGPSLMADLEQLA